MAAWSGPGAWCAYLCLGSAHLFWASVYAALQNERAVSVLSAEALPQAAALCVAHLGSLAQGALPDNPPYTLLSYPERRLEALPLTGRLRPTPRWRPPHLFAAVECGVESLLGAAANVAPWLAPLRSYPCECGLAGGHMYPLLSTLTRGLKRHLCNTLSDATQLSSSCQLSTRCSGRRSACCTGSTAPHSRWSSRCWLVAAAAGRCPAAGRLLCMFTAETPPLLLDLFRMAQLFLFGGMRWIRKPLHTSWGTAC